MQTDNSLIKHRFILNIKSYQNYKDTLKISLTKIHNTLPDFKLPFCCC